jgi:hypothetical protein
MGRAARRLRRTHTPPLKRRRPPPNLEADVERLYDESVSYAKQQRRGHLRRSGALLFLAGVLVGLGCSLLI